MAPADPNSKPVLSYEPAQPSSGLPMLLRALRSRNYQLFFIGQGTSLIGTWLTRIATSWLVYRLTGSAFLLGLVAFAGQIPTLIMAPVAGVFVDRWDRHRLLVVTQVLAMLQSFVLAVLTLAGVINIVQIILLSIVQGLINAFDMPARQAFLIEIVENRDDLPNAIALNSSMVNSARLLGPSIGGVLIASVGEGYCFLIDSISYIAVVVALLMMHVKPRPMAEQRASHLRELWEGVEYAFGFAPIRAILILTSVISIMGMSYTVLMPVFATQILHSGPQTLGFLMAASGIGALIGALYLASRRTILGLGRVIALASTCFGIGLIAFALSRFLWLSMLTMFVSGFAMITQSASSNTILQTIVEDDKRGRIMSFFSVAFLGMTPIGSLMSGILADYIGPSYTVAIAGSCCILAGLFFATKLPVIRSLIRPIYVEKGILPEVAAGIQSTNQLRVPSES